MNPNPIIMAKPIETLINILIDDISPWVTRSTWFEKTSKPGSAIDIKKPKMNPATKTITNLLVFVNEDPVWLPSGVIPRSTPTRNKDNPIMTNIDPIINRIKKGVDNGTKVKFKITTIRVIGTTAMMLSLNFSAKMFNLLTPFLCLRFYLNYTIDLKLFLIHTFLYI